MTVKNFSLGLLIALIAATFAAVLTVLGTNMLSKNEHTLDIINNIFSSSESDALTFVEIKNMVITLKSNSNSERYLLLELALTTDSADNNRRTEDLSPAIRGATVNLLSTMDYDTVREMNVEDLRHKLMNTYSEHFRNLNTRMPFKDVIFSKMIFQ